MKSNKKTASIIGVLFLIGFAGVVSLNLTGPILNDPDYLIKVSENKSQIVLGTLIQLIMAFATTSIAIWLYPILKKHNESLALGLLALGSLREFSKLSVQSSYSHY